MFSGLNRKLAAHHVGDAKRRERKIDAKPGLLFPDPMPPEDLELGQLPVEHTRTRSRNQAPDGKTETAPMTHLATRTSEGCPGFALIALNPIVKTHFIPGGSLPSVAPPVVPAVDLAVAGRGPHARHPASFTCSSSPNQWTSEPSRTSNRKTCRGKEGPTKARMRSMSSRGKQVQGTGVDCVRSHRREETTEAARESISVLSKLMRSQAPRTRYSRVLTRAQTPIKDEEEGRFEFTGRRTEKLKLVARSGVRVPGFGSISSKWRGVIGHRVEQRRGTQREQAGFTLSLD